MDGRRQVYERKLREKRMAPRTGCDRDQQSQWRGRKGVASTAPGRQAKKFRLSELPQCPSAMR